MNPRLAIPVLLSATWAAAAEPMRFEYEEPHMGTRFRVVLYAPDRATASAAAKAAFARVADLNRIMSDYLATSELMVLCQKNETVATAVPVSADLFAVLKHARAISEKSDGSFDVTVGPLVKLWRQSRRTQKLPDAKELADAKARVGWRNVELDETARTVKLLVPRMQLDLGGIAKGYAADEALATIARHDIRSALVAAGGDVAVSDAPPGTKGWTVDIAPLPGSTEKRTLQLTNAAVSTSGDLEQFVVIDGVRYSHILDPKTGLGLTERRTVTVVAPRGWMADGLTKTASVLPVAKGLEVIESFGAVGYVVRRTSSDDEVTESKKFGEYVVRTK